MKKIIIVAAMFLSSFAYALPEGGIECKNADDYNDGRMRVKLMNGVATFEFWESAYAPLPVTTAGTNTFAIVEEKVTGFGEGMEWVSIFSAFLVYNSDKNELSVTTVFDQGSTRNDILSCN